MKHALEETHYLILDGFMRNFDQVLSYSLTAEYGEKINAVDGVGYPHICADIPPAIREEVVFQLGRLFYKQPKELTLFFRRSPEGATAPHFVHSDESMGDYSLMLYLTDIGGTSFHRHKALGFDTGLLPQQEHRAWMNDTNRPEAWETTEFCPALPNRACLFKADRMHMAQPLGGQGTTPEDTRNVLTAFFRV